MKYTTIVEQFQQLQKEIAVLKDGACRFHCRTAKENWIDGYETALRVDDPSLSGPGLRKEAENEWKRRQTENT